jgi:hypothetical protein
MVWWRDVHLRVPSSPPLSVIYPHPCVPSRLPFPPLHELYQLVNLDNVRVTDLERQSALEFVALSRDAIASVVASQPSLPLARSLSPRSPRVPGSSPRSVVRDVGQQSSGGGTPSRSPRSQSGMCCVCER